MAEILGAVASSMTLAALFKTCIEAFDLIQTSRHQEGDFKKLKLRLNIEKCRLYIWGDLMGLTNTSDAQQDRPIDGVRFPEVVRDILETVFELFDDSLKIKEKYGCRQANSDDTLDSDQNGPVRSLAASFSNFAIRPSPYPQPSRIIQKFIWVIHDRKKFGILVAEIKDLVDSLQGITTPSVPIARQQRKIKERIIDIHDAETLSLIAEVCSEDHPDITDVASAKADTISLASTHQRHMAAWIEDVQGAQAEQDPRMSPDIESLTVAELKQKLLEVLHERKENTSSSFSASAPLAVPRLVDGPPISTSIPDPTRNLSSSTRPLDIHTRRENLQESFGQSYTSNQQMFSDPWTKKVSIAGTAALVGTVSSDSRIWPNLTTPRNIYDTRIQGTSAENDDFAIKSSVSSVSTSSNNNYLYQTESIFGSVDDPTDGSSAISVDKPELSASQSSRGFGEKASAGLEKKHKCEKCDKHFTRPSSLQTHMYSHTGEKPYACEFEGCGRHFTVVSNLRRHRKVHRRE